MIFVLKFEQVHLSSCCYFLKNAAWMSGFSASYLVYTVCWASVSSYQGITYWDWIHLTTFPPFFISNTHFVTPYCFSFAPSFFYNKLKSDLLFASCFGKGSAPKGKNLLIRGEICPGKPFVFYCSCFVCLLLLFSWCCFVVVLFVCFICCCCLVFVCLLCFFFFVFFCFFFVIEE